MTIRVLPPASGFRPDIVVPGGRKYSCAAGSFLDVPDHDAQIMIANGWTAAAAGQVGTTAQRPSNPKRGDDYHDSTLGKTIKFDGAAWRDPSSGSAV